MLRTMKLTLPFFSLIILLMNMNSAYSSPYMIEKNLMPVMDGDSTIDIMDAKYKAALYRLKKQAASLKAFVSANQFNTEYCFLIDMSVPSGKNRFFIYNLKKDSIEYATLVAHGWGSEKRGTDHLIFSNTPNSYQTSLGKYKIGYSYHGTFGLAYKLYGLDHSNSNAFKRAIVLHSETNVPDYEIFPAHITVSAGCPMVSAAALTILSKYINVSQKPVLMWIYN